MAFQLRNQNDPYKTLSLTSETWFGLLDLADEYGWNAMGTVLPGQWLGLMHIPDDFYGDAFGDGYGAEEESRLVLLEDALNLADALEEAFLEYEPVYVPASFFYFEPLDSPLNLRPSIGAINAVIEFCQQGAFWIEQYHRPK